MKAYPQHWPGWKSLRAESSVRGRSEEPFGSWEREPGSRAIARHLHVSILFNSSLSTWYFMVLDNVYINIYIVSLSTWNLHFKNTLYDISIKSRSIMAIETAVHIHNCINRKCSVWMWHEAAITYSNYIVNIHWSIYVNIKRNTESRKRRMSCVYMLLLHVITTSIFNDKVDRSD